MRTRYVTATIGFTVGFGAALLLGAILQAMSGTTYLVHPAGVPSAAHTSTVSWSSTASGILILILGGIGLASGYIFGYYDRSNAAREAPAPSWPWDLGMVVLLAVLSTPLWLPAFHPFGVALDRAQVALVAVAIVFGPGTALLAGGPGTAFGLAMRGNPVGLLLALTACGALQGAATGRLATRFRPARLLATAVVAAALGLLPGVLLSLRAGIELGDPLMRSIVLRTLVSVAFGFLIGILVRIAGLAALRSRRMGQG